LINSNSALPRDWNAVILRAGWNLSGGLPAHKKRELLP
jgi:hypothetical protein